MQRVYISIFFALTITFSSLVRLYITLDFLVRQDYIAQNLCENREKPELSCKGKCIFMQKINQASPAEESPEEFPPVMEWELSHFTHQGTTPFDVLLLQAEKEITKNTYNPDISDPAHTEIFHPPRFLS